jgi:hypothetical protein
MLSLTLIAHMFKHQLVMQDLSAWLEMKWNQLRHQEQEGRKSSKPTLANIKEKGNTK